MSSLFDRLKKEVLLMDGAMGTELQKKGLPLGMPSALWNLDHPEEVIRVHREYVEAGAQILLTNTFGASRIGLGKNVPEDHFINRVGVELAKKAARGDILVAGDVGPLGSRNEKISPSEVVILFAEQIEALAGEGVDLICLETMTNVEETLFALHAAKQVVQNRLPIMVLMTLAEDGKLPSGEDIEPVVTTAEALEIPMIGFNCSFGPTPMISAIRDLKAKSRAFIVAKPNAGVPQNGSHPIKAGEFAEGIARLIEAGANIVGGCCGTTPEYIRTLSTVIPALRNSR